jgi:probable F420-dependent oxidoreductase
MEFGVRVSNYGQSSCPKAIVEFAREPERLGYSSIWATDHLLMRSGSGTSYETTFESIVTLGYLGGLTTTVKLGVSSLVMGFRNPVVVAKQLATLDQLCRGRLAVATGAGWYEAEFQNLGQDFHTRGRRLNEALSLINRLWYPGGPLNHSGNHLPHRIRHAVSEPKPLQKHVEVLIAGNSVAAMRRSVRWADGWHPNLVPIGTFREMVDHYRGIEGSSTKKIVVRVAYDPRRQELEYTNPQGERRVIVSGDFHKNKSLLEELESLGVSGVVLVPNYNGMVGLEDQINAIWLFARRFIAEAPSDV